MGAQDPALIVLTLLADIAKGAHLWDRNAALREMQPRIRV